MTAADGFRSVERAREAGQREPDHSARDRTQRVLYTATGFAALAFALIHVPKIVDQWDDVQPWFAVIAVTAGVALPGSLVFLSRDLAPARLRWLAGTTVVLFAVAHACWPAAMVSESLAAVPWMQAVNAIPAFLAAVVWQRWPVWAYAASQWPIVAATEWSTTTGSFRDAALSGTVSLLFSVILVGVGVSIVRAAERQDAEAAGARAEAARAASVATTEREEARINGIVHDRVLAALVVAAREPHSLELLTQAGSALASLDAVGTDAPADEVYTPADAMAALRAAAQDPDGLVQVWTTGAGDLPVPGPAVRAVSEATAEAVRNSLTHAGRDDAPVERLARIEVSDGGITVQVIDNGRGFDPEHVPARRLGLRVSIHDRMRLLDNGESRIESRPGNGTTVTLRWRRDAT